MARTRLRPSLTCLVALIAVSCEVANPAYDPSAVLQEPDGNAVAEGRPDAGEDDTTPDEPVALDAGGDTAAADLTAQDELIAYWPFEEGVDRVTQDRGPARMRTLLHAATWTNDTPAVRFANVAALQFDGTGATADTKDTRLPTLANPFTICFWFRPDRGATGSRESLVTLAEPARDLSFHFGRYRDGRLAVWVFGGPELVAGPVPSTGQWQHAAYTWDGSTSRLWLDGKLVGSATGRPGSTAPTQVMFSGIPTFEFFAGALDEVRIYARAFNVEDIATLADGAY